MSTFEIKETLDEYEKIRGETIMVNMARAELAALEAVVEVAREIDRRVAGILYEYDDIGLRLNDALAALDNLKTR